MGKSWILVGDAHRARCFERGAAGSTLKEIDDFFCPQQRHAGAPSAGDVSGDAGKGHGRTAHSGKQFEPHVDAHAAERHAFARQLAKYLNDGVAQGRCASLALIVSGPMLGELRPLLSSAAQQVLRASVARDLTLYQGRDLAERIDDALAPAH